MKIVTKALIVISLVETRSLFLVVSIKGDEREAGLQDDTHITTSLKRETINIFYRTQTTAVTLKPGVKVLKPRDMFTLS